MGLDRFWTKDTKDGEVQRALEGGDDDEAPCRSVEHVFEEEGALGFNIKPRQSGRGAVVSSVTRASLREDMVVCEDMVLESINATAVQQMDFEAVVRLIKTVPRPLRIAFRVSVEQAENSGAPRQRPAAEDEAHVEAEESASQLEVD